MKFTRILLSFVLILTLCLPGTSATAADGDLRDGDRVVIWFPEKQAALSSVVKSGQLASVKVTQTEDQLSDFSDTEIWTLEQTADGWRFLQNGQALSMDDSNAALKLGAANDVWTLEAVGDGFLVKNTGRGRYLSYQKSRSYWHTQTAGTEVCFYILPREEKPGPPTSGGYSLYFGQLHAHTDLSDGTGTVEEAFQYASKVPGLDFFAVTDHSQSFDHADSAALTADAAAVSQDWARGKAAAAAVTDGDFVGIFGFEMTWNQGQGHMSTFRTPGFVSRDQAAYQSYANGMENYYAALLEAEGSISQFNHPGEGDFKNFAGYSPALDRRITLIEVGGGTASYDWALGKGWHLAPTNNQNNHAGHWGDESGARTVAMATALTEQGIYDAMANYRVYATEDADLAIFYYLDGHPMGAQIPLGQVGETVTITAELSDPTDPVGTVAVVTEGGTVLTEEMVNTSQGSVAFTLPADRMYYYLRITQADGDVAVTAPIWLDPQKDMGISDLKTASETTIAGKEQTFLLTLYNEEALPLTITAVTVDCAGTRYTLPFRETLDPYSTASCSVSHAFPADGVFTVTAEVTGTFDGGTRQFTKALQVVVMPPPLVDDVIIDGTHGTGESFAKGMALAEREDVDLMLETAAITPDQLETCCLLIIPAPAEDLEQEFVEDVKDYVNCGGDLILLGTSVQENPQGAARLNRLLEALGLSLRANADEATDPVHNAGTPAQLRTTAFSTHPWLEDLAEGQRYEQFSGCSVTGGQWLIKAMDGQRVLLAVEETKAGGSAALAGGAFLSDAHLKTAEDWELPSANQTILETLLGITHRPQEIIPLARLREAEPGRVYLAEGRVTAGTANPNTTFADTIYLQDDTGAIAAAPYSAHGLALGTRVRILGSLEFREGNPVLNIVRLETLGKEAVIPPAEADNDLDNETQGGQLLTLQGHVISAEKTADGSGVSRFILEDAQGNRATVVVEPEIRSGSRAKNELARVVKPGNRVSAVGLVHLQVGEPVLRLRDCDEVVLLWSPDGEDTDPDSGNDPDEEVGATEDGSGDSDGDDDDSDTSGEDPDGDGSDEDGSDGEGDPDGTDGDGSPETNPSTGDRSGIEISILLAILSLLAMAALKWEEKRNIA